MILIRWIQNRKWITLGMKILMGVALASNIFIGALLYFNLNSSKIVEQNVNQVLDIHKKLSSDLRVAVVELQNKFLSLPELFHIDPHATLLERIKREFKVTRSRTIEGRDAYAKLFSRSERRDLTKREFVIKEENGQITVTSGLFDDSGNFKDSVEQLTLTCENIQEGLKQLKAILTEQQSESESGLALRERVSRLGTIVADAGLQAEKSRNEILYHVEHINEMEHKLSETRLYQKKFTTIMGGVAILANMVALFILVRIIVERPLHKLTHTINEIRSGKSPDVPCHNRSDQIGVLSGAIINFSEALSRIRDENERKEMESIIIDEIFEMVNSVVQNLEERARKLVNCANTLHELATTTGSQSESVALRAVETATNTGEVSSSTSHLKSVVEKINSQIVSQNIIVAAIVDNNSHSQANIRQLDQSIYDINNMISIIREIADQTKLLALNASIEAARAGAKGQGFAVVAGEVKELSIKTQQATREVMEKVSAIEKASKIFFDNLHDVDRRVDELNEVTASVMKAVNEQKEVTDTIAALAGQTSENTRDVSSSIEEVSNAASRTRDLSLQVNNYSDQIASQLTDLLQKTSEKITRLNRISTESSTLSKAA